MDTNGYKMDISESMAGKLDFGSTVYQQISSLFSSIDTFRGNWQVIATSKAGYLKELRKIATIESIGSSTRIEGATLSDDEVDKLLKSVQISKLSTREQQEVVGYYDTLQVILDHYMDIELSERYLHQLHGILLRHSDKDQRHKGSYKALPNKVVANYPDGSQRTIFRTTEPHLTAKEMEGLLAWTNERFAQRDMHPLLAIAAFVYEFLSIHPYQDGNGRLSRLLATLLLLQQGYGFVQYISFEHIIEAQKEAYYRALMEGQKNRYQPEERIDKWVLYFLSCLVTLTQRLETKYATYSKLKTALNDRQLAIIAYLKEHKTATVRQVEEALSQYSRNTLKKDLAYLVHEALLLKTGAGRGVRYHVTE